MNTYFLHGKFFETKEEFFKFATEWPDLHLDLNEFRKQMEIRVEEAAMNMHAANACGTKFTNRDAYRVLRLCTDWAVEKDGL